MSHTRPVHIPEGGSQPWRGGWACFCLAHLESEEKQVHQNCSKKRARWDSKTFRLPGLHVMVMRRACSLERESSLKRPVWRRGDGWPDWGSLCMCVRVCACTHISVSTVSSGALSAPAGSEPSSWVRVVLQALKEEFPMCSWSGMCSLFRCSTFLIEDHSCA